ncbi:endo-1,4-beta-xylanase [Roseococcus sp. YIM B11640]|uniref:endo-1,4-beta-xylanase n=1 Tax=Roseococcus sp. YIM B11640 TaxID=3133973 RepID=UPI003C7EA9B3
MIPASSRRDLMLAAAATVPEARLAQLAGEKGILFGTMAAVRLLDESPVLLPEAIARDARIVVPGLELKWSSQLRPAADRFDFEPAERMLGFAEGLGLQSKGHALVWHVGLPAWVPASPGRAEAQAMLRAHITAVCRRFAGRLHSWDVVNEAIQPHEGHPQGLRNTPFLRGLGPDYIEEAFHLAAAADPQALRVLNDFNLEMNNPYQDARRRALLALLERLIRRGVPVQALGIQGHIFAGDPRSPFAPRVFERFLRDVASLGLRIQITELDVPDEHLPGDVARRDRMAAEAIGDYLAVALAERAVDFLTLWGLSDRGNYLDAQPATRRADGRPSRPHLYDADFVRKPAWHAVARALQAAPRR